MPRRPEPAPSDPAPPLPADRPGLEQVLVELLAERASLQDALAAHPDRERRLLARQAAEPEISSNDTLRRRIGFQLDELDEREQAIRAALEQADRDHQVEAWSGFVEEFATLSQDFAAAGRQLQASQIALLDLHRRAAAAGFNPWTHPTAKIPVAAFRIDFGAIEGFAACLPGLRAIDARAPERRQLYSLRFRSYAIHSDGRSLCGYQAGAIAGFEADAAWRIVEQGKADWVDAIPPRPAGLRKSKRTEVLV